MAIPEEKNLGFQTKFFWNCLQSSADLGRVSHARLYAPTSTARSSKAPRPAGVAVTTPPRLLTPGDSLLPRGFGRKGRVRGGGGSPAGGARGPGRDRRTAQVSAPLLAQPLAGRLARGRPLPCSAPAEPASASCGSVESGPPRDASRTPGPWEPSRPRLCVPGRAAWECPVSFDLGGPGEVGGSGGASTWLRCQPPTSAEGKGVGAAVELTCWRPGSGLNEPGQAGGRGSTPSAGRSRAAKQTQLFWKS